MDKDKEEEPFEKLLQKLNLEIESTNDYLAIEKKGRVLAAMKRYDESYTIFQNLLKSPILL